MLDVCKNKMNVLASGFDREKFDEIVKHVRNTAKAVVSIEDDRKELEEKFQLAQSNVRKAVEEMDYEGMSKFTAECKRLEAKLDESPMIKIQDYDKAMDALHDFVNGIVTEETQQEEAA